MYYATVVREKEKGASYEILNKYIERASKKMLTLSSNDALVFLTEAVKEFNQIDTDDRHCVKIGLIGEIYVKHNPFGNNELVNWLIGHGVEVVMPPLLPSLMQGFINVHVNHKTCVEKASIKARFLYSFYERLFDRKIEASNKIMNGFRHPVEPLHTLRDIAKKAEKIGSSAKSVGRFRRIGGAAKEKSS